MDLVIIILGWFALGVISAYLLAIVGKIIFDAATADYKLYKHVRLCRKRLLRLRYEDYAWLLLQLEKDTEVFNLTHNTRDWTFEDWREFYLKKAKEDKQWNKEKIKSAIEKTIRYMNGNYYSKSEEKMIVGYLEGALKELED